VLVRDRSLAELGDDIQAREAVKRFRVNSHRSKRSKKMLMRSLLDVAWGTDVRQGRQESVICGRDLPPRVATFIEDLGQRGQKRRLCVLLVEEGPRLSSLPLAPSTVHEEEKADCCDDQEKVQR
jgi:hypothetical protein